VRVSGKSRDLLQEAIQLLKGRTSGWNISQTARFLGLSGVISTGDERRIGIEK